jgi:hypothetical protein
MDTPLSDEAIRSFDVFTSAVAGRLDRGRRDYGDSSFTRPAVEILDELSQELLDLAGWSFILWSRLQRLERSLRPVPAVCGGDEPSLRMQANL